MKYIIDMPEGWKANSGHKSCDPCPFDNRGCQDEPDMCPLANAKEAVEVKNNGSGRLVIPGTTSLPFEYDRKPVTLYAVLKEADKC